MGVELCKLSQTPVSQSSRATTQKESNRELSGARSSRTRHVDNPEGIIRAVMILVLIREGVSPGHPYEFVGVSSGHPYELSWWRGWVFFFLRSPSCLFLCLEKNLFCVSTSPSYCVFSFEFTFLCWHHNVFFAFFSKSLFVLC